MSMQDYQNVQGLGISDGNADDVQKFLIYAYHLMLEHNAVKLALVESATFDTEFDDMCNILVWVLSKVRPNHIHNLYLVKPPNIKLKSKNRVTADKISFNLVRERYNIPADYVVNNVNVHFLSEPQFIVTNGAVFIDAPYPNEMLKHIKLVNSKVWVGVGYNTSTKVSDENKTKQEQAEDFSTLHLLFGDNLILINGILSSGDPTINLGKLVPEATICATNISGSNKIKDIVKLFLPPSEAFWRNQLCKALKSKGAVNKSSHLEHNGQIIPAETAYDYLMALKQPEISVPIVKAIFADAYAVTGNSYYAENGNATRAVIAALEDRYVVEMSDAMVLLCYLMSQPYSNGIKTHDRSEPPVNLTMAKVNFNVEKGSFQFNDQGLFTMVKLSDRLNTLNLQTKILLSYLELDNVLLN